MGGVKKGDFVEIDFVGYVDDNIFDTTEEETAKKNGLPDRKYSPVIICIGEGQLLKGIDDSLVGKDIDETYEISLKPEDAFGKKNASLIQIVPSSKFKDNKITPAPGMQINVDNHLGIIKNVSSGRVIVDFNHPLSGKEVRYEITVRRMINDEKEKVSSYIRFLLGKEPMVEISEDKAVITLEGIPDEVFSVLKGKLLPLTKLKDIEFKNKI